jgi:NAD(P)-dependent dehydrogenase (short-subunit alcohol dehydrogenase family)
VTTYVRERARTQQVPEDEVRREFMKAVGPSSLIGRFESPEEVAAMIVYASSAVASGTTGAALRVDGGVVRTIV